MVDVRVYGWLEALEGPLYESYSIGWRGVVSCRYDAMRHDVSSLFDLWDVDIDVEMPLHGRKILVNLCVITQKTSLIHV